MSRSRNHHYVPQLLLRNFCDGRHIWVGNKDTRVAFSTSPNKIFRERDLYTDHDPEDIDIKDDRNERLLQKIESAAAPVIEKIVTRGRRKEPPRLSSDEQDSWKQFYASMCRRTPEFIMKDLSSDEPFEYAWASAIEQLCAFTGFMDSKPLLSNRSQEIMKIKAAVKQNNKARFASGDHKILREDVEQFCRNTGILIAVICHQKGSFVVGSHGITTVDAGEARGCWLPVSPDVAVMPTP